MTVGVTRTINIDLWAIIAERAAGVSVFFRPDALVSSGEHLLIPRTHSCVTAEDGTATVDLPVKTSGGIRYSCQIGPDGRLGKFHFDLVLSDGDPILLSDLYVAGTGEFPQPIYDYIDEQLAATGNAIPVTGEAPVGSINGSNATFTTEFDFSPLSVDVTVNGLRQKRVDDFNTAGTQTITLSVSPVVGDVILVNYLRS